VRMPIRPFLVLMRPLCRFLRACKRKIDGSDWMCKRHRSDETVFCVTNSRCHANPSSDRVCFRRRCNDSPLQRITTAKLKCLDTTQFFHARRINSLDSVLRNGRRPDAVPPEFPGCGRTTPAFPRRGSGRSGPRPPRAGRSQPLCVHCEQPRAVE